MTIMSRSLFIVDNGKIVEGSSTFEYIREVLMHSGSVA